MKKLLITSASGFSERRFLQGYTIIHLSEYYGEVILRQKEKMKYSRKTPQKEIKGA